MAKSLRSKRKRKVRAEKRIVNAKKELVKLKEIAAKLHGTKGAAKEALESGLPDVQVTETPMIVDGDVTTCSKTKRGVTINNQWMNQRKIKTIKNKIKSQNRRKARRGGISSRKVKKSVKK